MDSDRLFFTFQIQADLDLHCLKAGAIRINHGKGYLNKLRTVTRSIRVWKNFWVTAKAAALIFISWRGSAISSAQEGKSGFI